MKITPHLTIIKGQGHSTPRRLGKTASAQNNNNEVGASRDLVDVVSLENRRAVTDIPRSREELDRLLLEVETGIKRMSRDEIKKLHRLEGLVHIFSRQ